MANAEMPGNRRQHRRFNVKNGTFAALTTPYSYFDAVGQIIDLSYGGTAFRYFISNIRVRLDGLSELTVVTSDRLVFLSNVLVKIVSDSEMVNDFFPTTWTRRCSVKFEGLTGTQKAQLQRLMREYSADSLTPRLIEE